MSGAAGFHRSSGDVKRSFGGARSNGLGYDNGKGSMGDILGSGSREASAPVPPPRAAGGVASLLNADRLAEFQDPRAIGRRNIPQPAGSAMNDVMTGVGELGADDSLYGLSKIAPANKKYSGGGALSALRWEEAEVGMDDPFAQMRARGPKIHINDRPGPTHPPPAAAGLPPKPSGGDPLLVSAHTQLLLQASKSARDANTGALLDYRPLLQVLAGFGLELSADGAGTLIATLDVHGSITYDEFLQCLAMGSSAQENAPAPAPPPPQATLRAAPVVRGAPAPAPAPAGRGAGGSGPRDMAAEAAGLMMRVPPLPASPPKADVAQMLHGRGAGSAATSQELAALLNRQQGMHARKSEMTYTVGKSQLWR